MSTQDRVEATKSNIEGKAQEMMGEVTGDPQDKAEGEAKQQKAEVQHSVEDAKDKVKQAID